MSAAAAARAGLKAGTPLCIGAGDQNSAAVGAGIVRKGYLSVSLGTGGLAAAYLDEPFRDPNRKAMVDNHAVYGKWQLEGLQAGAAGVFRWFRDEIAALEKEAAASAGTNVYEPAQRDDRHDPARREGAGAASLPRQRDHAALEPARARDAAGPDLRPRQGLHGPRFMEGITLEVRDMVNSMVAAGIPIQQVRILGGATKSEVWNQMQADVYNRPVQTLKMTDAALMGAALFAAVGDRRLQGHPRRHGEDGPRGQAVLPGPEERGALRRDLRHLLPRLRGAGGRGRVPRAGEAPGRELMKAAEGWRS